MRPIYGMIAGFPLLFGGIFLVIAWQVGPQPMMDAARYKAFTAVTDGRIVESCLAMEFDPAVRDPIRGDGSLWRTDIPQKAKH